LGFDLGDLNIKRVAYKHKGLRSYLPGLNMWPEWGMASFLDQGPPITEYMAMG